MTPAFGGQCSIQLSYGCVGIRVAKRVAGRQPLTAPLPYRLASVTGWNWPRPQLAPRMMGLE